MAGRNKADHATVEPVIGLIVIELHFPDAGSLKAKRMVVKSIKERLKGRFNVAVAETGYLELWQRAELVAVTVASARTMVESHLEAVDRDLNDRFSSELVRTDLEIIG